MSVLAEGSPTVTIFADHGPLVTQIGEELRSRGAATHTVSIEVGWVESVSFGLIVLDSPAGVAALRDLSERDVGQVRVVALMTGRPQSGVEELVQRCTALHGLVLVHGPADDLVERVVHEVLRDPQTS